MIYDLAPDLPTQPFIDQNREPIGEVFWELKRDFPDSTVTLDGIVVGIKEALDFDNDGELTPAAREFLWVRAQGKQHGYDKGVDGKLVVPASKEVKYMDLLEKIQCGDMGLVRGGPARDSRKKNVFVMGGFPHLNGGRLYGALDRSIENLFNVGSVVMLAGARPRWDHVQERTAATVIEEIAISLGYNLSNPHDLAHIEWLKQHSTFMRREAEKSEAHSNPHRTYATEYQEARLALELAIRRAEIVSGERLFDWEDNPVRYRYPETDTDHEFEDDALQVEELTSYLLANGQQFYVVNAPAIPRPRGGEPRPTSESTIVKTVEVLGKELASRETSSRLVRHIFE